MREKEWQEQVIELAGYYRWLVYHTYDSRRSAKGFPDLVLVREHVIFAELKTDRGRLSVDQRRWLEALRAAGQIAELWRPRDFERVHAFLRGQVLSPLPLASNRARSLGT